MNERRALVLGGGADVWDEVLALEAMLGHQWDGIVIAANDVGIHWPRELHHWCTLHPTKLPVWIQQRRRYRFPNGYVTWGRSARHTTKVLRPWPGGSSGMMAVQIGYELECQRIVLCGVPMTATRHFSESTEKHLLTRDGNWAHADKHWRAWEREAERLRERTRSMSGRTQALLGGPTAAWVKEEAAQ